MSERQAGEFLRQRVFWRAVIVVVGLLVTLMLGVMGLQFWPMSLVAIALVLYLDRQSSKGRWLDPRPWRHGLRGERAVASALEQLPEGFRVIHDLDIGRGNVDHIVIGPTGVFAIETKDWKGRFYAKGGRLHANGREEEKTRKQAVGGAIWVGERLKTAGLPRMHVEALIVSTSALVSNGEIELYRAKVLDVNALVDHILRAGRRLTPEQVGRAAEALHASQQLT